MIAAANKLRSAAMTVLAVALLVLASSVPALAQNMEERGWTRVDPQEIQDNPVALFGKSNMALAVGEPDDLNAMAIGWGGLGTLWGLNNATVTVYVEQSRHTHSFMERNEFFTLTAFPDDQREGLIYLGTHSGRDEDKIANSGLTLLFTENGNPAFAEGRLILECRKIYQDSFDPEGMGERGRKVYAGGRQLHTIFIGEIINAWVK